MPGDIHPRPSGSLSRPTAASILGIKGHLRFRPHGSSQKAHVVLRRVELDEDSEDEGDGKPAVYFSLFAQKRIEVKPGKEILLMVENGPFKDQAMLFEGDALGATSSSDEEEETQVAEEEEDLVLSEQVMPPKMRKNWTKRPSSTTVTEMPKPESLPHVSIGVQAQPEVSSSSVQAVPQPLETACQASQTSDPPKHLHSATQTDIRPSSTQEAGVNTSTTCIEEKPALLDRVALPDTQQPSGYEHSLLPIQHLDRERSLSPMELDSPPSSPPPSPVRTPSDSVALPGKILPVDVYDNSTQLNGMLPSPSTPLSHNDPVPSIEQSLSNGIVPHKRPSITNIQPLSASPRPCKVQPISPDSPQLSPRGLPEDPEPSSVANASSATPPVPKPANRKAFVNPFVSGGFVTDFVSLPSQSPGPSTQEKPTSDSLNTTSDKSRLSDTSEDVAGPVSDARVKREESPATLTLTSSGDSKPIPSNLPSATLASHNPSQLPSPTSRPEPPKPDPSPQSTSTSGVSVSSHPPNAVSSRPGSIDFNPAVFSGAISRGPVSSALPTHMQQSSFPEFIARNKELAKSSLPVAVTHPVHPSMQHPPFLPSASPTSRAFPHISVSQPHPLPSSTSSRPMSPLIPGLSQSQNPRPPINSVSRLVTPTGPRASFIGAPNTNGNSFPPYGSSMPHFPPQSMPTSTSGMSQGSTSTSSVARDQNHTASPSSLPAYSGPSSGNAPSGPALRPMSGTSSAVPLPRFVPATSLSQPSSSAVAIPPKHSQAQATPTSPSGFAQTTSDPHPISTAAAPPQANLVKHAGAPSDTKHTTPIVAPNSTAHHPVQRPPINTPTAPRAGPSATQVAVPSGYTHGPTPSTSGLPAHPLPQKPKAMAPMPRYPRHASPIATPLAPRITDVRPRAPSPPKTVSGVKRKVSPPPTEEFAPMLPEPPPRVRRTALKCPLLSSVRSMSLPGDGPGIRGIMFSSTGSFFAVNCHDSTIRVWDNLNFKEIAKLTHKAPVVAAMWLEYDVGILSLSETGSIAKWTRQGDQWHWSKVADPSNPERRPEDIPTAMAYIHDRIAVAIPRLGVKLWMLNKGQWQQQRSILRQNVTAIRFVEDGDALLGGTKDGVLWYCQVPNGTLRASAFLKNKIYHIDVNTAGTHALVSQLGGRVHLVAIRQADNKGNIEQVYALKDADQMQNVSYESGVTFVSKCQLLVYGCADGSSLVWNKDNAELLYGLDHGENAIVEAVGSFSGNGVSANDCLVTGTKDGRLTWFAHPPVPNDTDETAPKRLKAS